jgi:hypothetical protein
LYEKNPTATTFLEDFDEDDIMLIQMSVNASILWHISPPNLNSMINELRRDESISITTRCEIHDLGYLKDKESMQKFQYELSDLTQRELLIDILLGNSTQSLIVPRLLPKFLHVSSTGRASVVGKLASKTNRTFLKNNFNCATT